jgi:malate dehydrogenase (oxaloacetate-decarboxylating)(NADP+)
MKMAAVKALAHLAKQEVPESVSRAYGGQEFKFGRDYLIPKPFDRRVLLWVAPAVAEAAIHSGVARKQIDIPQYRESLERLLGSSYTVMRGIKNRVKTGSLRATIVFPEGEHPKILRAAFTIREEGIAEPILIGNDQMIQRKVQELGLCEGLKGVKCIYPSNSERLGDYALHLFEKRQRKGVTLAMAQQLLKQNNYYGAMMVEMGDADGLLNGISQGYPDTLRPAIQVIGVKPGSLLAGIYMMVFKKQVLWFADTTVNIDPGAEQLAEIAIQTADLARKFMVEEPRVAMLSFSNFGSNSHPFAHKVRQAVELIKKRAPQLVVDGEMQADTAVRPEISIESFPFNQVPGNANILIFPDLQSGNVAYKLMARMGSAEAIGPILVGMSKPVFVLQQNSDVNDVVNMAAITAMEIVSHPGK